jgi:uncharacterized membrane protein YfcA
MATYSTAFLVMVGVVTFIISLSKGGLGGMLGALSTPLMVMVMPANKVLGLLLPIMLVADLFALAIHWKKWNARLVGLLLPGAVIGVTLGTIFLATAPVDLFKTVLAVIALSFVVYKILEKHIIRSLNYVEKNWHGWLAGTTSGFISSITHSGGSPIIIYFMLLDVTPQVFVATSVLFFAILNWIKVPYYLYIHLFDFQQSLRLAWVLPIVPVGALFGRWIASKISKQVFDWIMTALLALAGILLLVY